MHVCVRSPFRFAFRNEVRFAVSGLVNPGWTPCAAGSWVKHEQFPPGWFRTPGPSVCLFPRHSYAILK